MTKKDFELIATTIKSVGADGALCMGSARDRVALAEAFAMALQSTNPRFDYQRFLTAATDAADLAEALKEQYA